MPKTQWSGSTLHYILKRYQPGGELFGLQTFLSTGNRTYVPFLYPPPGSVLAYPPGYLYSIPIRIQQIAELEHELKTPRKLLL